MPKVSINPSPSFHTIGVDYAEPFARLYKRIGEQSAVHIELVSDLASESFLPARFISRSGKPFKTYSDNETTFVGTKTEFDALTNFMEGSEISFLNQLQMNELNADFVTVQIPDFGCP